MKRKDEVARLGLSSSRRSENAQQQQPVIIANRFRLISKLGQGSFGDIFQAVDMSPKQGRLPDVAIKFEFLRSNRPQLRHEYDIYQVLRGGDGIAETRWFGIEGDYRGFAMDLLGLNLQQLMFFCGNKLSLKTILMLADQMITRLEYVHDKGVVHRDLKPQNFLMGTTGVKANTVHLVDYGLSDFYIDPETHKHIDLVDGHSVIGTSRYASINNHMGLEQSRRDDMEALGYVLLYLLHGELPWVGVKGGTSIQKEQKILEMKAETPLKELCGDAPEEFIKYFEYCRALKFKERPNYDALRELFRNCMARHGFLFDFIFDWTFIKLREHEDKISDGAMKSNPDAPPLKIVPKLEAHFN